MAPSSTILVVDDTDEIRTLLVLIVGRSLPQARIVETNDLDSALAALAVGNITGVITDHTLCDQTGIPLVVAAREADVPVIMVSADLANRSAALAAGANAFVTKPFELGKFMDLITQLFQH